MTAGAAAHRIVRYFSLRPALSWSLASLAVLCALLFIVRWGGDGYDPSQMEYTSLELVPMAMTKSVTQADISVSPEAEKETVEEKEEDKPLRFGDENGEFTDDFEGGKAPMPIYSSLPDYPRSMKKAGIEGVVVIEIGLDDAGSLLYGRIIRTLGREFDMAAINWVKSIRFRPGMDRDGRRIRCRVRLPIRFKLEE